MSCMGFTTTSPQAVATRTTDRRGFGLRVAAGVGLLALGSRAAAAGPVSGAGSTRSALVIGNAAYRAAPLRNPVRDARLIGDVLARIGFHVVRIDNAGRERMASGLRQWVLDSRESASRFFYFAGHGTQLRGRNYLLPVDADIGSIEDVPRQAVDITDVGEQLARASRGVNILVLDACRNQPYPVTLVAANGARSVAGWLAPGLRADPQPAGTLIAFATAPGAVAQDGPADGHSVYTRHLASALDDAGVPVESLFKRVRTAVARETANKQMPWETSSLVGEFCLVPGAQGRCEPARSGLEVDLARRR
jgi:uncharacterized caspase-like protein